MDIRDIAKKAGVSISTVSRILNNSKPVSPELRRRVEKVITDEAYVPNSSARSMVTKRTRTISLVLPEVSAFFHQTVAWSIEHALSKHGYHLIVVSSPDHEDAETAYLAMLQEKKVDGIILMRETENPHVIERIESSSLPVVLASILLEKPKLPAVRIDDRAATREGTDYLLNLGHRRIGLVAGYGHYSDKHRIDGFYDALAAAGIDVDSAPQQIGYYTLQSGYDAAMTIIRGSPETTALFVLSDEMAVGALRAAKDIGRRVPDNLSILGFDGIELGGFVTPALTSIYQPCAEIGKKAAETMLMLIEAKATADDENAYPDVLLPHRLSIRESCGPPAYR